jgi:hypothetical protein
MDTLLVLLVFAVLLFGAAVYAHRRAEKRKATLMAWAQAKSLSFSPGRVRGLDAEFPGFPMLHTGDNRYAFNLISGDLGRRRILAFDYHYETTSTDGKGNRTTHTHVFSAVILQDSLPLRTLAIRPENFLDRIGEFLGFDDIDFELAEFSREFHVSTPDRKWAFDVLHQKSMEFLLESPRFSITFHGGCVMAFNAREFDTATLDSAVAVIEGLLALLPPSVVRELSGANR